MAATKNIDWGAQPLGETLDSELAERLGCSGAAVGFARRERGIPAFRPRRAACEPADFRHLLGKITDREIAERYGLTQGQVSRARRMAGIHSTRNDWSAAPLGEVPDIVLARRFGVDNKVVAEARWRRGVKRWSEERECACGERYTAKHRRQRFCSPNCQRYHWLLVNKKGVDPQVADLRVALRAYRRTAKRRG